MTHVIPKLNSHPSTPHPMLYDTIADIQHERHIGQFTPSENHSYLLFSSCSRTRLKRPSGPDVVANEKANPKLIAETSKYLIISTLFLPSLPR